MPATFEIFLKSASLPLALLFLVHRLLLRMRTVVFQPLLPVQRLLLLNDVKSSLFAGSQTIEPNGRRLPRRQLDAAQAVMLIQLSREPERGSILLQAIYRRAKQLRLDGSIDMHTE